MSRNRGGPRPLSAWSCTRKVISRPGCYSRERGLRVTEVPSSPRLDRQQETDDSNTAANKHPLSKSTIGVVTECDTVGLLIGYYFDDKIKETIIG